MSANSDKIGEAIRQWISELDFEGDGDIGMLGDWISIACMVSVDNAGHPVVEYYVAMRDGALLPHIAEGLIVRLSDEVNKLGRSAE